MDQSESAAPKKGASSQTSFKAFGVEFSGPSWVAIVFLLAAILTGAVYLAEQSASDQTAADEPIVSPDAASTSEGAATTAESPSEQPATTAVSE